MTIVVDQSDSFEQWRQKTNQIALELETESSSAGNIELLTTTANSSIVAAVNELDSRVDNVVTDVGSLTSLTTTANSSIVAAVNELDSRVDNVAADLSGATSNIGLLTSLTTTANTNLVAAVNEVDARVDGVAADLSGATSNIGLLTSLTTTANSNLVSAINELDATIDSFGTLATQNTAPVSMGGTGRVTLATGSLISGNGTGTVNLIAPGTSGNVLVSDGNTWVSQTIVTGGTGEVTSVDVSGGTTGLTTTGGPITSAGTITLTGNLLVASGGTGVTTVPVGSFLTGNGTNPLVVSDASNTRTLLGLGTLATLNSANLTTNVTGILPIANGGTNASTASAARTNLGLGNLATLNSANLITNTDGVLPISKGGTGKTSIAQNYMLVGNSDGGFDTYPPITVRAILGLGTLATLNSANLITNVTGILPVANGGTGATTDSDARTNLGLGTLATLSAADLAGATTTGVLPITKGGTNATTASDARTNLGLGTTSSVQITSLGVGTSAGASGEIRATNNITAYYSDDRLKTRIGNIQNALEKVNSLNGFYYEANEIAQELGYEKTPEVGVSAQEVQKIMPEVVVPAPIDDKYLTVRYEKLIPLLIESIKELTQEVNELKKRLGE